MIYVAVAFVIYVLAGVLRVWSDFRQPFLNQPFYVAERKWLLVLLCVLIWPFLFSDDIRWWYSCSSTSQVGRFSKMKVYHVKGPSPIGDVDIQIHRCEITAMKKRIMADGKQGYSEMLRVMSHPAAIARVRMVPGTHALQWLLNTCLILGRVGIVGVVVLLLMRYWWWALGCAFVDYLVVCFLQTHINYEVGARLFVLDIVLDREFNNIVQDE